MERDMRRGMYEESTVQTLQTEARQSQSRPVLDVLPSASASVFAGVEIRQSWRAGYLQASRTANPDATPAGNRSEDCSHAATSVERPGHSSPTGPSIMKMIESPSLPALLAAIVQPTERITPAACSGASSGIPAAAPASVAASCAGRLKAATTAAGGPPRRCGNRTICGTSIARLSTCRWRRCGQPCGVTACGRITRPH